MDDKFNFQATLASVNQAVLSVVCHIVFDFAMHGFMIAAILATCAVVLAQRKHRFSRPLFSVSRRMAIFCGIISIPGLISLCITGALPATGVYTGASLGFIVFWSMVTIYMCGEEMNYQWFIKGNTPKELTQSESSK